MAEFDNDPVGTTYGGGRYIRTKNGLVDLGASHAGAGATPKEGAAAPQPAGPSWGDVGADIAKSAGPEFERGGTLSLSPLFLPYLK